MKRPSYPGIRFPRGPDEYNGAMPSGGVLLTAPKKRIPLRGGQSTTDVRLDRVREVDLASLLYPVTAVLPAEATVYNPRSHSYRIELRMDQLAEGKCVSMAHGHDLAAYPGIVTGVHEDWCREFIYWPAQRIDEWAGGSYPGAKPFYEGTSVLAGFKIVKAMGAIAEYRWALDFMDLVLGVGYWGPCVIGVDWYSGMFDTDDQGFIHPTGYIAGGHSVLIVGVRVYRNRDGSIDFLRSYFTILNSWGPAWGQDGKCKITFVEMMKLFPGGDFGFAVGRRKTDTSKLVLAA